MVDGKVFESSVDVQKVTAYQYTGSLRVRSSLPVNVYEGNIEIRVYVAVTPL